MTARPWSRWRSRTRRISPCPRARTPRSARSRSRGSPTATSTSICPPRPTGRRSTQADTTSEVDLDQLFNTLNKPTVDSLKQVIQGFARGYDGVGPKANRGFHYLNPFLSTSRRVFAELNSDQANLESLVVDAAGLTSTLAAKSPEISQLVANLNGMLGTIGEQQASLASAVAQLPDFMRQFDTTAVNLRAALDDVQPLVNATLPASADALRDSRDQVATLRAYSPELTGWFDDFGHSGFPDAFGGIGRISTTVNAFTPGVPGVNFCGVEEILGSLCNALNGDDLYNALGAKFLRRCPGSNERGF